MGSREKTANQGKTTSKSAPPQNSAQSLKQSGERVISLYRKYEKVLQTSQAKQVKSS